jgi:hypothetical protein
MGGRWRALASTEGDFARQHRQPYARRSAISARTGFCAGVTMRSTFEFVLTRGGAHSEADPVSGTAADRETPWCRCRSKRQGSVARMMSKHWSKTIRKRLARCAVKPCCDNPRHRWRAHAASLSIAKLVFGAEKASRDQAGRAPRWRLLEARRPGVDIIAGASLARRTVNLPLSIVKIRLWLSGRFVVARSAAVLKKCSPLRGDRGFESGFLQRRVACELDVFASSAITGRRYGCLKRVTSPAEPLT